ncbi:MAG: hypothetical protein ACRC50_00140 [Gaiella sp.]
MSRSLVDDVERALTSAGEPDDALREVVALLAAAPGVSWAGIAFTEEAELVLGPSAGTPRERERLRTPVVYQGATVGELWLEGELDEGSRVEIAAALGAHVLLGWDTGGAEWVP